MPTLTLRFAAASDVGLVRDNNEDSGYAGPHLLVVADGMGGAAAGEVASSVAVAALARLDDDDPGGDLLAVLAQAVQRAEEQLAALVDAQPTLGGMGTTLTALLRSGSRLGLLHIGDSRAYLVRGGELAPITHDHTLVQSLIDAGRLTQDEAQTHPQRSILTRTLDGTHPAQPDLSVRELESGDRLLVCSDGLSGVVSQDTIAETLARHDDPQDAVDALVALALKGGGPDNVTCVIADVVPVEYDASDEDDEIVEEDSALAVGAVSQRRPSRRLPLPDTPAGRAAALVAGSAAAPMVRSTRRQRRRVVLLTALGMLVVGVIVGAVFGWYAWARQQYFVATSETDSGVVVAVYRGPAEQLFGIKLSELVSQSDLLVAKLPEFEQEQLASTIPARGPEDADAIVQRLREEALACAAAKPPAGCPESP
ncbi:MAG: protein phosphatase 2C domain-containing protein [Actinomycetota bacterium]|nr:protein phosphatase 2C domain-containing protein [Actinomycetota bacterium]